MIKKIKQAAVEAFKDPAAGFATANTLFYATVGGIGLYANIATIGLVGLTKAINAFQPKWLEKDNLFNRIIKHHATPLFMLGTASTIFAGSVGFGLATGGLALGAVAPQLVMGSSFAVSHFMLGRSLAHAKKKHSREFTEKAKPSQDNKFRRVMGLIFKRPDLYLSIGTAASCLITGGASILALPAVGVAFGLSVKNAVQEKPEHHGHPKLYFMIAGAVSAAVGIVTGDLSKFKDAAPVVGQTIVQATNLNFESQITPGGFKQILRDVKNGVTGLFKRNTAKKAVSDEYQPQPTPQPSAKVQGTKLAQSGELSQSFKNRPEGGKTQTPKNDNKPKPGSSVYSRSKRL